MVYVIRPFHQKGLLTHHFRVLRHFGLNRQIDRHNNRARCCADLIDQRLPGLIAIPATEQAEL